MDGAKGRTMAGRNGGRKVSYFYQQDSKVFKLRGQNTLLYTLLGINRVYEFFTAHILAACKPVETSVGT